jgi:magnesium chelatase family protein
MVQWPQKYLVVAGENQYEALKGTDRVIAVRHLSQIGELQLMPLAKKSPAADQVNQVEPAAHDMMEVCGQPQARHALEIAAAGRHSLLLVGPPGCGKSLLARCLPSIMPPLNEAEAIEVNKIYSVAGLLCDDHAWIANSPFRDPHVRVTRAGMLGGGSPFKPGEISLAHHGVLYLDEIPEMDRVVLESLRQPLEDGSITIRQAWGAYHLPADFQLVGSANPCYCGYYGDGKEPCRCTAHQLKQYRNKLSGPLLDRIAMQVLVPRVQLESLQGQDGIPEASATIRQRVCQVRAQQQAREKDGPWGISELHGCLTKAAINLLKQFDAAAQLTARSYTKVLKVARTIADLSGQDAISAEAVAEAFQFRQ